MFSLIITVLSVVLTAVMLSVTQFSGGDYETKGTAHANAVALINQGAQLQGFNTMYEHDPAYTPLTSVQDLVTAGYLTRIPTSTIDGVAGTWTLPVKAVPAFLYSQPVSAATCEAINQQTRGDSGVYSKINIRQEVQCFGSSNFSVLAGTPAALANYAKAVGLDTVDGVPGISDAGWTIAPSAVADTTPTGYSCSVSGGYNAIPTNGYGPADQEGSGYSLYVAISGKDAASKFSSPSITYDGIQQVNPAVTAYVDSSLVSGTQLNITAYQLAHTAGTNLPLTLTGAGGATATCLFNSVPYTDISAQNTDSVTMVYAANNTNLAAATPGTVTLTAISGSFKLGPNGEKPVVSLGQWGTTIVPASAVTVVDSTHLTFVPPTESALAAAGVSLSALGPADAFGDVTVFSQVNNYMASSSAGFMLAYSGAKPPAGAFKTEFTLSLDPNDSKTMQASFKSSTTGAASKLWSVASGVTGGFMALGLDYTYTSYNNQTWPAGDPATVRMHYYIASYDVNLPGAMQNNRLVFKDQNFKTLFTAMLQGDGTDTTNTWCIGWTESAFQPGTWQGVGIPGACS